MDPNTIVQQLMNLGIGGLMAAFLVMMHWHMVKVMLPQIVADFKDEMKQEREQHDKHISAIIARLDGIEKQIFDLIGGKVGAK